MKGFLGAIGIFSWIGSALMCYQGYTIYNQASTIMQQGLGMDYIIYSGVLFLGGLLGLGFSMDSRDYTGQLESINNKLYDLNKK